MRDIINLIEQSSEPDKLYTTPLNYGLESLSPVLSKDNLNYHFEHLAKGYAKKFNTGEGDPTFNKAGSYLHNKLFAQYKPPSGANRPKGEIQNLINSKFKSFEDFKDEFKTVAMGIQGSGWVYLSTSGKIKTIPNHSIRTDIILLVDWWEHAWSDYQWKKDKYIDNIWKIIDWNIINERF
jgi:superoxide dismutase